VPRFGVLCLISNDVFYDHRQTLSSRGLQQECDSSCMVYIALSCVSAVVLRHVLSSSNKVDDFI